MHFVDQVCCVSPVVSIVCSPEQLEKVADCKCIGPKISLTIPRGRTQAGSPCEFRHQSSRLGRCAVPNHFAFTNIMWSADANARNCAALQSPSHARWRGLTKTEFTVTTQASTPIELAVPICQPQLNPEASHYGHVGAHQLDGPRRHRQRASGLLPRRRLPLHEEGFTRSRPLAWRRTYRSAG